MYNIKKKILFILLLMFGVSSITFASATTNSHIKNVTAISEVFGDGQKVSAVVLEYDTKIDSSKLKTTDFKVEDRTITKVYTNNKLEKATKGVNGKYVIIELDTKVVYQEVNGQMGANNKEDKQSGPPAGGGPQLGSKRTSQPEIKVMEATVTQVGTIRTTLFKKYKPTGVSIKSTKSINLVVEDFKQLTFTDENHNKQKLMYNLFVPKNYDSK